jgi:alpha-galactosidase
MMSTETLAAGGTAFVSAERGARRWTIGNAVIAKTLAFTEGRGLHLAALEQRATGHVWQPDLGASEHAGGEFLLAWNDVLFSGRSARGLEDVRAESDPAAETVTLRFNLDLGEQLGVALHYRVRSATGAIEQWLTVTPSAGGVVSRVAPVTAALLMERDPVLHWARGIQNHGHYMPRSGPYPAYEIRHETLAAGAPIHLESGLRSTWHELPWLALDGNPHALAPAGATGAEGLFLGLHYSGRWSAEVARLDAAGRGAAAALVTLGYATPLAAGDTWQSPGGFLGVYCGDLDAAAHVQHAYMRRAVLPPLASDYPWVQYNTWFAHLVDIDEEILRREADLAARLGCEVFVIDAGWWEPSRRTSDNFTTGLGLWRESAEKFPHGLRAFADYVRALGMRFGIWVEPERVDIRRPGTWRDAWLARHHNAIISPAWPPDTVSGWLCFGHPDVQAWAVDWISALVADLGADWLKWDSNWWGVCTCDNHHHSPTDGEFHQVQGVHNVLAELRRRFPNLAIENCAGGGTRTDFAMLANSHATWLHDASTPSRRVRFHLAGANYLFPPEICNTFVVDADDEPLTDPSTTPAELAAIARSRMLGAFGVSARLPQWTEAAFAAVQAAIVQYKELRPLLKTGRFYHLLPQAEFACPDLPPHGQWEAYAIVAQDARAGAAWVFRAPDGVPVRTVHLRGLDPQATYTILDVDTGQTVTAGGAEWMAAGLEVDLAERTSALFRIAAAHPHA